MRPHSNEGVSCLFSLVCFLSHANKTEGQETLGCFLSLLPQGLSLQQREAEPWSHQTLTMRICMYKHVYVRMCMYMCVHVWMCVHVPMDVRVNVFMLMEPRPCDRRQMLYH